MPSDSPASPGQFLSLSAAAYSGPIPPPAILKGYDDVVPGLADRIAQQWEKQSNHRMDLESYTIKSDNHRSWGGLIAGFVVSLASVLAGCWAMYLGYVFEGSFLSGGTIATLAAVFIYGTRSRRQERLERAAIMANPKRR